MKKRERGGKRQDAKRSSGQQSFICLGQPLNSGPCSPPNGGESLMEAGKGRATRTCLPDVLQFGCRKKLVHTAAAILRREGANEERGGYPIVHWSLSLFLGLYKSACTRVQTQTQVQTQAQDTEDGRHRRTCSGDGRDVDLPPFFCLFPVQPLLDLFHEHSSTLLGWAAQACLFLPLFLGGLYCLFIFHSLSVAGRSSQTMDRLRKSRKAERGLFIVHTQTWLGLKGMDVRLVSTYTAGHPMALRPDRPQSPALPIWRWGARAWQFLPFLVPFKTSGQLERCVRQGHGGSATSASGRIIALERPLWGKNHSEASTCHCG